MKYGIGAPAKRAPAGQGSFFTSTFFTTTVPGGIHVVAVEIRFVIDVLLNDLASCPQAVVESFAAAGDGGYADQLAAL